MTLVLPFGNMLWLCIIWKKKNRELGKNQLVKIKVEMESFFVEEEYEENV